MPQGGMQVLTLEQHAGDIRGQAATMFSSQNFLPLPGGGLPLSSPLRTSLRFEIIPANTIYNSAIAGQEFRRRPARRATPLTRSPGPLLCKPCIAHKRWPTKRFIGWRQTIPVAHEFIRGNTNRVPVDTHVPGSLFCDSSRSYPLEHGCKCLQRMPVQPKRLGIIAATGCRQCQDGRTVKTSAQGEADRYVVAQAVTHRIAAAADQKFQSEPHPRYHF